MGKTEVIQVKLDNDDTVFVEIAKKEGYTEVGLKNKIFEVSSDYIKVASNIIKNLKSMDFKPDSIELEFGVKLTATSGKAVSWIVTDAGAEASIGVKMKWEKEKEKK